MENQSETHICLHMVVLGGNKAGHQACMVVKLPPQVWRKPALGLDSHSTLASLRWVALMTLGSDLPLMEPQFTHLKEAGLCYPHPWAHEGFGVSLESGVGAHQGLKNGRW